MPWGKNDYYAFLLILLIIVVAGVIAAYFLGALSPDGIINFLPISRCWNSIPHEQNGFFSDRVLPQL